MWIEFCNIGFDNLVGKYEFILEIHGVLPKNIPNDQFLPVVWFLLSFLQTLSVGAVNLHEVAQCTFFHIFSNLPKYSGK